MKISVGQFKGAAPRLAPHLLPDDGAQTATNVRVTAGSLRALNTPAKISATLTTGTKSVYSLGPQNGAYILSWNTDTDVARSPVSDAEYRIYYTNGATPKKTSLALASGAGIGPFPVTEYLWGVPAPTAAPTAANTTGSVPTGTYVYVFTYVTQFGTTLLEESAPSPSVTTTLAAPGGVTLTFPANPSTTGRNYVYKRIYRTTGTAFQLVAQVAFSTPSYTDTLSSTAIPGDPLATVGWLPPPDTLQGVVSMPSGTMAGFKDNEIWFSEPGFPHAWPAKYMQALDAKIVAIWAFGNNLVVATQMYPYIGSGVYPDSFTFQKIARLEPCVSKRSMAGDETGAIYASKNGLVSIGLGGDALITEAVFTRQEFAAYVPESITATVFEGRYYGFYNDGSNKLGFVFSQREQAGIRSVNVSADAVTVEPLTTQLLYVDSSDKALYYMDPVGTVPMTYTWKSKLFRAPQPVNMGYVQVLGREDSSADTAYTDAVATANAVIAAANSTAFSGGVLRSAINDYQTLNGQTLNGSTLQDLIPAVLTTVTLYVYAGSTLRFSKELELNKVYTLPSGFKMLGWELMIVGQREVIGIELANSVQELRAS